MNLENEVALSQVVRPVHGDRHVGNSVAIIFCLHDRHIASHVLVPSHRIVQDTCSLRGDECERRVIRCRKICIDQMQVNLVLCATFLEIDDGVAVTRRGIAGCKMRCQAPCSIGIFLLHIGNI